MAQKWPAGPNTQSGKQEDLSNGKTANPSVSNPDLSVKSQGDTDTAKLRGTVATGPETKQFESEGQKFDVEGKKM